MDSIRKCRSLDNLASRKNTKITSNKLNASKSGHKNKDDENGFKIRSCLLTKTKSPTPKLKDLMTEIRNIDEIRDHIRTNIIRVKNTQTRQRPKIVQDSCDGHRQDSDRAGLELKYVFKKEYGRTPQYLRRRRHTVCDQKEKCPDDLRDMRRVEENEKQTVLNGLKNNLKEVEKRLLSLPVITDTLSKQRRKLYWENLLQKLEQDIEMLENHDIIVFKD